MKRALIILLMLMCTASISLAQTSDDIYVRKDVFDVHMQNINSNLERILSELQSQREEIKSMRSDINELAKVTSVLSARIDGLENRMGDLRNDIYLGLVILSIIVALPSIQRFFQWRESRRPSLTLEDVERLIDARLTAKSQNI